ncbi:MAG: O-antigen ligase family protein [Ignavibacteria bacterium]|nr:O-antigen ligase family protein [Ignavibacteria bacterium]
MNEKEISGTGTAKYLLYLLISLIPLTVTKLLYSQSDLPKAAVLIIFGGIFISSVMIPAAYRSLTSYKTSSGLQLCFNSPLDAAVLIFFCAAVISTVFSINPLASYYGQYERQVGLITFIYLTLIYFFAVAYINKQNIAKKVVFVLESAAVVVSVYAIMQQLGMDPFDIQPAQDKRPVTTIGSPVFTGGFLAIIFPLALLNVSGKSAAILKWIFPLLILCGVIVTRTRSAYLAVIAEAVILTIVYFAVNRQSGKGLKKKVFIAAASLVVITAGIVLIFPDNIFVTRVFSIFSGYDNQRWLIWKDALKVFWKYPFTGPGIAMFPNALTEFYSYALRRSDMMRTIDNAHSNYLQVLCSMGVVGLLAYSFLLLSAVRVCLRNIFAPEISAVSRHTFTALLVSISGYAVYGLTNFDDITILLGLFLLFLFIRVFDLSERKEVKFFSLGRAGTVLVAMLLLMFFGYNAFIYKNKIIADHHFLNGEKLMNERKYKQGISEINAAVIAEPENPTYRLILASEVYEMVISNRLIEPAAKNDLLRQAAEEVSKARKNYFNVNSCDALLAMIYFESGRDKEADELTGKVLAADEINFRFRMNLTSHFLKAGKYEKADQQLSAIEKTGYLGIDLSLTRAAYYLQTGDYAACEKKLDTVLSKDPYNRDAIEMKRQAEEKLKLDPLTK